jgi:hypothetical protein
MLYTLETVKWHRNKFEVSLDNSCNVWILTICIFYIQWIPDFRFLDLRFSYILRSHFVIPVTVPYSNTRIQCLFWFNVPRSKVLTPFKDWNIHGMWILVQCSHEHSTCNSSPPPVSLKPQEIYQVFHKKYMKSFHPLLITKVNSSPTTTIR